MDENITSFPSVFHSSQSSPSNEEQEINSLAKSTGSTWYKRIRWSQSFTDKLFPETESALSEQTCKLEVDNDIPPSKTRQEVPQGYES